MHMSETHELIATGTATAPNFETAIDIKEISCGGKYIVVEVGANYCSNCGEEL